MKKKFKILLSIILPILSITSICLSFLLVNKGTKDFETNDETIVNPCRFQANYYALAEETSPAQGESTSYKGGSVFLEPDSIFLMIGGTIQNHSNKFGGAIFISEGATFTMEGGTITGCSATYGGAIYVSAGGTCNINAGTITGNTASYGPSIYAEKGAIVNISADTVIDDNSVELNTLVTISTDTIPVGDASANFGLHYVEFGSYPQSYVGDTMNAELTNWYNSNNPTNDGYYEKSQPDGYEGYSYESYIVPSLFSYTYMDGEKYVQVAEKWYKVEPIKWVVLNYDNYINGQDSFIEIMSYQVLNKKFYYWESDYNFGPWPEDIGPWSSCTIRKWLNDIFYLSAFTAEQREIIQASTELGVSDNVYLLSYERLIDTTSVFENIASRRTVTGTNFASDINTVYDGSDGCLTSSHYLESNVWYLDGSGNLSTMAVYDLYSGVRPVIRLVV